MSGFHYIAAVPEPLVTDAAYARLLGFPTAEYLEGRAQELADQTRRWYALHGRPWTSAVEVAAPRLEGGRVRLEDAEFVSPRLHEQFAAAGVSRCVVMLASAGVECEDQARESWREEKPDEYFFMEVFGSAVTEALVTQFSARLCSWAEHQGLLVLPHYSPGYTGWNVADQEGLFNLLQRNAGTFPAPVRLLSSGMLQPKKSLLALFGLTTNRDRVRAVSDLIPCQNCAFSPCQFRRSPFLAEASHQLEDACGLQPQTNDSPPAFQFVLNPRARYSVRQQALEKWGSERLRLESAGDGGVKAVFQYEGTTCSNLGRHLFFEYHVQLSPRDDGYRILSMDCHPGVGRTGFESMCAYLRDSKSLMEAIREEKPLLGRTLDEAPGWDRQYDPAGCYCEASAREHKWGLVFEVLHYALARQEQVATAARVGR